MANEKATQSLERGNIYFFYRPKVEKEEVKGKSDIQRLHLVLSPHGKSMYRKIVIPKKSLPDINASDRKFFAFVDKITSEATDMRDELQEDSYSTKTRGERTVPAMRPIGEGVYVISRHEDHTHLFYALELPDQPGEVQEDLHVEAEGNMIISVKNPERPAPRNTGLPDDEKADYPEDLQNKFRGRAFISVDPPKFLDYEGTQLLFIGAGQNEIEDLDVQLNPQEESASNAEIFNVLRLLKSQHPVKPLFEGEWQ